MMGRIASRYASEIEFAVHDSASVYCAEVELRSSLAFARYRFFDETNLQPLIL